MDDNLPHHTTKRLTKQPPPPPSPAQSMPSSRSLRSQSSAANLGRNNMPATNYVASSQPPQRANSTSSPQPSPSAHDKSSELSTKAPYGYSNRDNSDESFGSPTRDLDTTKATGYQASLRRPGPPQLIHTNSDPRMLTPSLRQSASFSAGDRDVTPPTRSDTGFSSSSSSKRHSDDSTTGVMGGKARWRKKSGISGFMNSMLGSPRNVKISAPENPVHMIHVGYDNATGKFTVRMPKTRCRYLLLKGSGFGRAYLVPYRECKVPFANCLKGPAEGMGQVVGREWDHEKGARRKSRSHCQCGQFLQVYHRR